MAKAPSDFGSMKLEVRKGIWKLKFRMIFALPTSHDARYPFHREDGVAIAVWRQYLCIQAREI